MALTNINITWKTPNATISIDGATAVSYTGTTANLQLQAGNHTMVLTTANETVTKNLVVPTANADRIQSGIDTWIANNPDTTSEQGYFEINSVNYNDGEPYAKVQLRNSGKARQATHVEISASLGTVLPYGLTMDSAGVISNYSYISDSDFIRIPHPSGGGHYLYTDIDGLKLKATYTDGEGVVVVVDEMDVSFLLDGIPTAEPVYRPYVYGTATSIVLGILKPNTGYSLIWYTVDSSVNEVAQVTENFTSSSSGTSTISPRPNVGEDYYSLKLIEVGSTEKLLDIKGGLTCVYPIVTNNTIVAFNATGGTLIQTGDNVIFTGTTPDRVYEMKIFMHDGTIRDSYGLTSNNFGTTTSYMSQPNRVNVLSIDSGGVKTEVFRFNT